MGLFDKGFGPVKEAQKAADVAGKGIVDAAGQAVNAAQGAVGQATQAVGDLVGKVGGSPMEPSKALRERRQKSSTSTSLLSSATTRLLPTWSREGSRYISLG